MTKVNKPKLFEDYIKNKLESYEALHLWPPEGIVIFKNSVEKMLNDLALKQAELEEKIDFIMGELIHPKSYGMKTLQEIYEKEYPTNKADES